MARRKSVALAVRQPTVIAVPAPRPQRRLARRAVSTVARGARRVSRVGGAAAAGAWRSKETIAMVGGAGLVGYLEGAGHLDFIPDLVPGADAVGRLPTLAVVAYGLGVLTKSPKIKTAGLGLAAAAALGYGLDKGKKAREEKGEPEK